MKSNLLSWLVLLFGITNAFSQDCNLQFTGQVIDNHDDQPLVGAVIRLNDDIRVTDGRGQFQFDQLCPNDYELVISHIDCEDYKQQIALSEKAHQTFYLEHHESLIQEILIEDQAIRGTVSGSSETLSEQQLNQQKGESFGDLLQDVTGVSLLKTGATITKPVINGLHSQRILLVNNGLRMEGQQWGAEHAPEVDPYAVQSISVIKGSGSVAYGSDGIGGVIIIEPQRLPDQYGIKADLQSLLVTNGRGGALSADIYGKQKVLGIPLGFELQTSLKKQGNLKSPDYYLDNTGTEEANFQLRGGYIGDQFGIEGKISQYNSALGLLTDSHIGNEEDLLTVLENGRPLTQRGFSYDILRPRQKILHEIDQIEAYQRTKLGKIEFLVSRQYSRRGEYDRDEEEPGLRLKTETYTSELDLKHQLGEKWQGKIGGQYQNQRYRANGFYLIPEYDQSSIGLYGFENYQLNDKILLEAGLRYDNKRYTYYIPFGEFRRLDDSSITYSSIDDGIGTRSNRFDNLFSGSSGLTYDATDKLSLSTYLGFGARQPLPNELYSDGVHHGTALWEVGNPNLDVERSTNFQVNIKWQGEKVNATINAYNNRIDNYTYLFPDQNLDPIFTVRGVFPIYRTTQTRANLLGLNYSAGYQINEKVTFETTGSLLRGEDKSLDEALLFMPSNQFYQVLTYSLHDQWTSHIGLRNVLKQRRTPDSIQDYAAAPDSYALVDASIAYSKQFKKNQFEVGVTVDNVFNTDYRNYLDRYRYFAASPGINFGLRLHYKFN